MARAQTEWTARVRAWIVYLTALIVSSNAYAECSERPDNDAFKSAIAAAEAAFADLDADLFTTLTDRAQLASHRRLIISLAALWWGHM